MLSLGLGSLLTVWLCLLHFYSSPIAAGCTLKSDGGLAIGIRVFFAGVFFCCYLNSTCWAAAALTMGLGLWPKFLYVSRRIPQVSRRTRG